MIAPEALKWDSEFFGFPVYRLEVRNPSDWTQARDALKSGDGRGVCYFFCSPEVNAIAGGELAELGGLHCGSNVLFGKNASGTETGTCGKRIRPIPVLDDAVRNIAMESGRHSRFAKDARFAPRYEALYSKWIENGFLNRRTGEGEVFGAYDRGQCVGLISVGAKGGAARIELLSVAKQAQRCGFGKLLAAAAEHYAFRTGANVLKVTAQKENMTACRFYEASGFAAENETVIWHVPA